MEPMHLLVRLLVGLSVYACLAHGEPIGVTEAISTEQRKVHEECQNPDYKQYLKCLMRPKRHHHTHGDGPPENDPLHCLETCLKKCELEHDCEKKCSHCTKRTKHRHQIVTEYEVSCESGHCNGNDVGLRPPNITTNIDINNIIHGVLFNDTVRGIGGKINGDGDGGGRINGGRGDIGGGGGGDCVGGRGGVGGGCNGIGVGGDVVGNQTIATRVLVPSIPLVPQISMVPQITYGIGLGGGCMYSQWLCIQQGTQQIQQPDCSVCGNPLLYYKCNTTFCYSTQSTAKASATCKSPACIGGST